MADPVPNVELLDRTLAYIEEHPEEWDQKEWVCGSTACFAGNALLLEGLERIRTSNGRLLSRTDLQVPSTGASVEIAETAKCALGLTDMQARTLFAGFNNMAALRQMVANIKVGRPTLYGIRED